MSAMGDAGRLGRTVRRLHAAQVLGRVPHLLLPRVVRRVPAGLPPRCAAPQTTRFHDALWGFARAEHQRIAERVPRLDADPALQAYEREYSVDPDDPRPRAGWAQGVGVRPYPAAVRARRLATAITLGHTHLRAELARACRAVLAQLEVHLLGNHLLENALGLCAGAAVSTGLEAELWARIGQRLLLAQAEEQFLPDGGHVERSASYHLALLAGLLEVEALTRAHGGACPAALRRVSRRALAWAHAVAAPDGTYPLLNDAALDAAPTLEQVRELARALNYPDPSAPPGVRDLGHTGWVVVRRPESGLFFVADVGPDGASYQPGHAHADALTFELWLRGRRAIVDYGVERYAAGDARRRTRATASHNTVEVAGQDSAEPWGAFRLGRGSQARLLSLREREGSVSLCAEHTGYAHLPGAPRHRRTWTLGDQTLRIEDALSSAQDQRSFVRVSGVDRRAEHPVSGAVAPEPLCEQLAIAPQQGYYFPLHGVPQTAYLYASRKHTSRSGWRIPLSP